MTSQPEITDTGRLLFGAGFVFGVAFTMLLVAIVTATVAGRVGQSLLANDLAVTIAAGIFFATVVGVSLFFLAFPDNRLTVPGLLSEEATAEDDA